MRVVAQVQTDPTVFVGVLTSASSRDDALARLASSYGCALDVAEYLLDMRVEFLAPHKHAQVLEEIEQLERS